MNKVFFLAFLPLVFAIALMSSCAKSGNEILDDFDYPEEELFGTWKIIEKNDNEVNETGSKYTIVFGLESCTYWGQRYSYKADGKKITLTDDGELKAKITISKWSYPTVSARVIEYYRDGDVYDEYSVKIKKQ